MSDPERWAMKTLFILVALLCGCVNKLNLEPEPRLRENLSEYEILSLHAGITVKELASKTDVRRFSELRLPIFIIDIKDQPEKHCVIFFDEKSGLVLCAIKSDQNYGPTNDPVILWPQQLAGQRATEENLKFIDLEFFNQK
jgi:hypothetical protein